MIIVCEPQCKGISHTIVNSGYLFGLLHAYPKEKITFFADTKHFQEIKDVFKSRNVKIDRVKHIPIKFKVDRSFSVFGILSYIFLFKKIFDYALGINIDKIFFLSTNPIILYSIKKLKQFNKYKKINCTFVLHGELEDIANKEYMEPYIPVINYKSSTSGIFYMLKKYLTYPQLLPQLFKSVLLLPFESVYSRYSLLFKRRFRTLKMMMWRHSNQYNYISMSPHVTNNSKKYLNVDYLNFHTIVLPIIFAKQTIPSNNKYIKFAVFGYGDSAQMQKMLVILSKMKITKQYEIRIISMDNRGTEGFSNVTCLSQGRVLTRKEMEEATRDIDVFINLYDKTRHKFGCSLSILESFSYLKPVLHLSNPGYNYFNKPRKPIGYRADTLNEFVDKMIDMIENYSKYKAKLLVFRKNMKEYRKEYAIENNLGKLKDSFTFAPDAV